MGPRKHPCGVRARADINIKKRTILSRFYFIVAEIFVSGEGRESHSAAPELGIQSAELCRSAEDLHALDEVAVDGGERKVLAGRLGELS